MRVRVVRVPSGDADYTLSLCENAAQQIIRIFFSFLSTSIPFSFLHYHSVAHKYTRIHRTYVKIPNSILFRFGSWKKRKKCRIKHAAQFTISSSMHRSSTRVTHVTANFDVVSLNPIVIVSVLKWWWRWWCRRWRRWWRSIKLWLK